MAQSQYLTAADAAAYGISASAGAQQIGLASTLIDGYLRRPKGLVYLTDTNGNPCMMAAATPSMSYIITGATSPGVNVTATVSPSITPDFVGEVLVIDPGLSTMEACQVTATSGNNVTLATVQFAHSGSAVAQTGLTLIEERPLPNKRSVTMLAEVPAVNILSLMGRYAYGRRSDQVGGLYQEMNLLASIQTFGGPPQWILVSPQQASLSPRTGELWVPAGILLAYYSDVRVRYIAGYTAATIPPAIKTVCASIVTAMSQTSGTPAGIADAAAGSSKMKRFTASIIDSDMQRMLDPYTARLNF